MVGDVKDIQDELHILNVMLEVELLLHASVVDNVARVPCRVDAYVTRNDGCSARTVDIASQGATQLATPTCGVGQAILHGEAIVEAPSIHSPLQRVRTTDSGEAVKDIGDEAVGYVVVGRAVVRAVISVRVIPVLRGALSERVLREVKAMRPGVIGVELNVLKRVVDDLANQRAVV